jgi:hypothetical protein
MQHVKRRLPGSCPASQASAVPRGPRTPTGSRARTSRQECTPARERHTELCAPRPHGGPGGAMTAARMQRKERRMAGLAAGSGRASKLAARRIQSGHTLIPARARACPRACQRIPAAGGKLLFCFWPRPQSQGAWPGPRPRRARARARRASRASRREGRREEPRPGHAGAPPPQPTDVDSSIGSVTGRRRGVQSAWSWVGGVGVPAPPLRAVPRCPRFAESSNAAGCAGSPSSSPTNTPQTSFCGKKDGSPLRFPARSSQPAAPHLASLSFRQLKERSLRHDGCAAASGGVTAVAAGPAEPAVCAGRGSK